MHIELTDYLRCTGRHPDTWLVATTLVSKDRVIVEGSLGCHICGAEYPIRKGVVHFDNSRRTRPTGPASTVHHHTADADATHGPIGDPASDPALDPWRLAALLNLDTPGKAVLLAGTDVATAVRLAQVANAPRIIVASTEGFHDIGLYGGEFPMAAVMYPAGDAVPIASRSLNAIAVLSGAMPPNAASLLVGGARLVAPASSVLPEEVAELARDEYQWVARRDALPSRLVVLKRQSS